MAKFQERLKARAMRRKGISIIVIARKLRISKSSVSDWCSDIKLTGEQLEILRKNKGVSFKLGQRLGADANKKKRLISIEIADNYGRGFIRKVSNRELALVATALYWSEGSKTDSTSTFMFVNSDPEMVFVMKKFLTSIMDVASKDIVCRIQINEIHKKRIQIVLNFWKKLLKLNSEQIKKPYFVKTKIRKIYDNHDNYFGVCRLSVQKGKNTKYKMLGLIKALKSNILSA